MENEPVRKLPFKISVSLIVAALSMAGCAGHMGTRHYYVLNLPAPVTAVQPPRLGTIAVREFEEAGFLRGGRIAYRQSTTEIGFYDYHRWAVDPRRSVTDAVVRQMQALGAFRSVSRFDGQGATDFLLTGTINDLEEVDGSTGVSVECSISAQLIDMKSGETVWHGDSEKSARLVQPSITSVVELLSVEMQATIQTLVGVVRDRLVSTNPVAGRSVFPAHASSDM